MKAPYAVIDACLRVPHSIQVAVIQNDLQTGPVFMDSARAWIALVVAALTINMKNERSTLTCDAISDHCLGASCSNAHS